MGENALELLPGNGVQSFLTLYFPAETTLNGRQGLSPARA